MKADDKTEYGESGPEKFTNFEELVAVVEELKDTVNEHAAILRENELVRTKTIDAPYFDYGKVFKYLGKEF